jgi:Ser-tRNA(Ala) deacylase AlaX
MTVKMFWDDSYLTQLETRIASVNGNDVTVERTIFYAFSGGQESDFGTIGNKRVLQARKENKKIIYTMEDGHGFKPGDPVIMEIDWDRRYKLMRLHFAAEIVLELVYRILKTVEKVGAHIAEDKARIDFEWNESILPLLGELQQQANAIVDANQNVISAFSDEENEKRYWKIEEFSQVPCGGTHIRKTGEIGRIELKRNNRGKGRERIEIHVGENSANIFS